MSRNKQVDRLEAGMKKHWTGKIKDPVGSALDLMDRFRADLARLRTEQERDKDHIDTIFMNLWSDLYQVGLSEELVITRKGGTPISLGELGWVDRDPKFDTEDAKIRLITIVWMVISSLRDKSFEDNRDYHKSIGSITKRFDSICDNFHKTLMKLGIWLDPPGKFEEMLEAVSSKYQMVSADLAIYKTNLSEALESHASLMADKQSEIDFLKLQLQNRDNEIDRSCVIIKDLTKELKYQVTSTKQYKRELGILRSDIIDREISGDKL